MTRSTKRTAHLRGDEHILEPAAAAADHLGSLAFPQQLHRRHQSKEQAAGHGECDAIEQHAAVQRDQRQHLLIGDGNPRHQRNGELCHRQTRDAPGYTEQRALEQKLADNLPARCAHRKPDRDLLAARRNCESAGVLPHWRNR